VQGGEHGAVLARKRFLGALLAPTLQTTLINKKTCGCVRRWMEGLSFRKQIVFDTCLSVDTCGNLLKNDGLNNIT